MYFVMMMMIIITPPSHIILSRITVFTVYKCGQTVTDVTFLLWILSLWDFILRVQYDLEFG